MRHLLWRDTSFSISTLKKSAARDLNHWLTLAWNSASLLKRYVASHVIIVGKRWQSLDAKSRLYGVWSKMSHPKSSKIHWVQLAVCGNALPWKKHTFWANFPDTCFERPDVVEFHVLNLLKLGRKVQWSLNDFFVDFHQQVSPQTRPNTASHVVNIGVHIFKTNTPYPHSNCIRCFISINCTELAMDFNWFVIFCQLKPYH